MASTIWSRIRQLFDGSPMPRRRRSRTTARLGRGIHTADGQLRHPLCEPLEERRMLSLDAQLLRDVNGMYELVPRLDL